MFIFVVFFYVIFVLFINILEYLCIDSINNNFSD